MVRRRSVRSGWWGLLAALLLLLAGCQSPVREPRIQEIPIEPYRAHHYLFAHRFLPIFLFQDPQALRVSLSAGGQDFIVSYWDYVGEDLPKKERLSAEGLSIEPLEMGPDTVYLLTLPAPQGQLEAYYIAVVFGPSDTAYFALENNSMMRSMGLDLAFFCAWEPLLVHVNYGPAPVSRLAFLDLVKKMRGPPEGHLEPLSRTSVPIE